MQKHTVTADDTSTVSTPGFLQVVLLFLGAALFVAIIIHELKPIQDDQPPAPIFPTVNASIYELVRE